MSVAGKCWPFALAGGLLLGGGLVTALGGACLSDLWQGCPYLLKKPTSGTRTNTHLNVTLICLAYYYYNMLQ